MKKLSLIAIILITAATLLPPAKLMAQGKSCPMPDNGFWVLVSNDRHPQSTTIKYYDGSAHLVYQEHLAGAGPDCHKKSTCRTLNRHLEDALIAYNENHRLPPDLARKDR
jgi:hypothetical protein